MTTILALDLSKRSTGWALWSIDQARPVSGVWSLGSELTSAGTVFLNLHQRMNELYSVSPYDTVIYEEPLNLDSGKLLTNKDTTFLLMGLATHVDSFCEAKRIRKYRSINNSSWRRHFIGRMKRGTKTPDLKAFAMERCRQLGLRPSKHDEADALGILDYMCECERIIPPWRKDEVLLPVLTGARG